MPVIGTWRLQFASVFALRQARRGVVQDRGRFDTSWKTHPPLIPALGWSTVGISFPAPQIPARTSYWWCWRPGAWGSDRSRKRTLLIRRQCSLRPPDTHTLSACWACSTCVRVRSPCATDTTRKPRSSRSCTSYTASAAPWRRLPCGTSDTIASSRPPCSGISGYFPASTFQIRVQLKSGSGSPASSAGRHCASWSSKPRLRLGRGAALASGRTSWRPEDRASTMPGAVEPEKPRKAWSGGWQ